MSSSVERALRPTVTVDLNVVTAAPWRGAAIKGATVPAEQQRCGFSRRFRMGREYFFRLLLLVAAVLTLPEAASANKKIAVGDGTPASCTEAALDNALTAAAAQSGATIRFNCGTAPVVITLTATVVVPNNTTIDGGGLITIQVPTTSTPFGDVPTLNEAVFVDVNTIATLENLNVSGGVVVLTTSGTLTVRHSTIGDGISNIENNGTLTIDQSTVSGQLELVEVDHPSIANSSVLTIRNSTVGPGLWALNNFAGGMATIFNSIVTNNRGFDLDHGAINNGGSLTVENGVISNNSGAEGDAGILNFGILTVANSVFIDNASELGTGAIDNLGTATIMNSTFSGNSGYTGGAFLNDGGMLTIRNSTIINNIAVNVGGGILNMGSLHVASSTISQNSAYEGGGIYTCLEGQSFHLFGIYGFPGGQTVPCHGTSPTLKNTSVTGNTPDDIVP
jgi:hypothetical protein